jgi:transcriptional regulator with XRE-family HTH domain
MNGKLITYHELMDNIAAAVREQPTQKDYAAKFGMSAQYLSDVLNGKRQPGEKVLDSVGYERVIMYRKRSK